MQSQPSFQLPEIKTQFTDVNEKSAYIKQVMDISMTAIKQADTNFNQLLYPSANACYLVGLDGFILLLKLTQDDFNFQSYLKNQMNYLFA
jgi:hypothetical protein